MMSPEARGSAWLFGNARNRKPWGGRAGDREPAESPARRLAPANGAMRGTVAGLPRGRSESRPPHKTVTAGVA